MSEHSPLPWFVHDFADPAVSSDPSPTDVTISCDHPATITVATMDRAMTATLEEARANAAFIVHAVNVHNDLVYTVNALINALPIDLNQQQARTLFNAEKVLARAEGRSALATASQTKEGE